MTNITIRIDDDVKRDAEVLFERLGLTMSGAINVFFRQAIREQSIPFRLRAEIQPEPQAQPEPPKQTQSFEEKGFQNVGVLDNSEQTLRSEEKATAMRLVVAKALAELEEEEHD